MPSYLKDPLINFFDNPFFMIFGGICSVIVFIGFLYTAYLILTGILPVLYRLGKALSSREVAVFASNEYTSLGAILLSSKIFKKKNITQIHRNTMRLAKTMTLFVVFWPEYKDKLDEILAMKDATTPLIIYAPRDGGSIDSIDFDKINSHPNATIVNLRGRLLSDIVISMITTGYVKK